MKRILVTKMLPDGYGVGVMPEMEKPKEPTPKDGLWWQYEDACKKFETHLASLPTLLIHPSLNPKEGAWIEQWREGWELDNGSFGWESCIKEEYEKSVPQYRRIVLLPLVEKGEESANFIQIVPDSHSWSSIEMLLRFLEGYKNGSVSANYLIIGLQNTKNNGYQLSQPSPPPEGNTPASEQGDEEWEKIAEFLHISFTDCAKFDKHFEVEISSRWMAEITEMKIVVTAATKEKAFYDVLVSMVVACKYSANPKQSPPSLQEREKEDDETQVDELIKTYIGKMWGSLSIASVEYFTETGKVNGEFKIALSRMIGKAFSIGESLSVIEINRLTNLLLTTYENEQWNKIVDEMQGSTITEQKNELRLRMKNFENDNLILAASNESQDTAQQSK